MTSNAAGTDDARSQQASLALKLCLLNVGAIVFLQRLIVPLGANAGVSILLPLAAASLGMLILYGSATIDPRRLVTCLLFVSAAAFANLFSGAEFSFGSVSLLIAIYMLLTIRIWITSQEYTHILRFFVGCTLILAGVTLVQIGLQAIGLPMPILEWAVPDLLIVDNFNYLQEISWRSGLYKPNGIFMLESSFLSQFLGLGLVVEYWKFGRPLRMGLLGVALALTFSGTGLLLAVIVLILMVLARGVDRKTLILLIAAGLVGLALLASGYLSATLSRVEEFSREDSSAYLRFIAPVSRIMEFLREPDLTRVFLGFGAGAIDREIGFAWNPPVKVLIEYGLIAWGLYWLFLASMARAVPSSMIATALALEYLLLGGGALLQPPIVFLCQFLGFGYAIVTRDSGTRQG